MIETGVLKKTIFPYIVKGIDDYEYANSWPPVFCRIFETEWDRDYQIALDEIEEKERKRDKEYLHDYFNALNEIEFKDYKE